MALMPRETFQSHSVTESFSRRLREEAAEIAGNERLLSGMAKLQYYRERFLLVCLLGTPEVAELGSAFSFGLFGIWMFLTGDLFHRYPAFFRGMVAFGPEWAWATVLLVAGIAQFAGVITGWKKLIRGSALAAAGFWVFIAAQFLHGDWRAPSIALLISGAIANVWIYLRTSRWWWMATEVGASNGSAE